MGCGMVVMCAGKWMRVWNEVDENRVWFCVSLLCRGVYFWCTEVEAMYLSSLLIECPLILLILVSTTVEYFVNHQIIIHTGTFSSWSMSNHQ